MSASRDRTVLAGACVLAIAVPAVAVEYRGGRPFILGERNPSNNRENKPRVGGHRQERHLRHAPVQQEERRRRRRQKSTAAAQPGQRALHPREQPQGRSPSSSRRSAGRPAHRTGDAAGAPFTTNATGVATGLNADAVDGRDGVLAAAGDFKFARVNGAGTGFEDNIQRGATAVAYRPGHQRLRRELRPGHQPLLGGREPDRRRGRRQAQRLGVPLGSPHHQHLPRRLPQPRGPGRFYIR